MAKNIFSPIITKLLGLVDTGLIIIYTKFEGENWSEVDFFIP